MLGMVNWKLGFVNGCFYGIFFVWCELCFKSNYDDIKNCIRVCLVWFYKYYIFIY